FVQCLRAEAARCSRDDRFRLDAVPVVDDLPELTIKSLALTDGNQALNNPDQVLQKVVELFPGGERLNIQPYSGSIDIGAATRLKLDDDLCKPYIDLKRDILKMLRSCRQAAVDAALDEWWRRDEQNRQGYDILLAVHR